MAINYDEIHITAQRKASAFIKECQKDSCEYSKKQTGVSKIDSDYVVGSLRVILTEALAQIDILKQKETLCNNS